MAIALQGTPSLYEFNGSTSVVVPYPTGIVSGELLLLHVANSGTVMSSTPPSGWTLARVHQTTNASPSEVVFYKIAAGTETGSVTFDATGTSGRITGIMERWSGVDTTTPFDIAAISSDSPVATTFTMTLGTSVTANAVVVHTIGLNAASAADIVTLAGTTQVSKSTGTGRRMGVYYETVATPGAMGTRTWTETPTTTALQWTGIVLVLRPAAGGGSSFTASASLSGSGTLTSSGKPAVSVNSALSGSGTLAATGKPAVSRSAAFSGSGTLTASAAKAVSVSASLSGVGTLTATAGTNKSVSVSLSGSGTLAQTVTPNVGVNDNLSGSGTLTATSVLNYAVAVNLSGLGSLTTTVLKAVAVAASLSGSGTLSSVGGQGALINVHRAELTVPPSAEGYFNALGGLSASATWGYRVAMSFWAVGTLSSVVRPAVSASASFAASGALTATTVMKIPSYYTGYLSPKRFEGSLGDKRWKGDLP